MLRPGLNWRAAAFIQDAQWLASLFPADVPATVERPEDMMVDVPNDPRALLLCSPRTRENADLRRAAQMGYAPAQAEFSTCCADAKEELMWAERASAQGNRCGMTTLAYCYERGVGCKRDTGKALELYREAAELDDVPSMHHYGELEFGSDDWQRYYYWGRAAARGYRSYYFCVAILPLVPSFENGECGHSAHCRPVD
jgi:hypothetical protein